MMVVIPVIIVVIYLKGYFDKFAGQGTGVLAAWMAVSLAVLALIAWFIFGGKKKQAEKR